MHRIPHRITALLTILTCALVAGCASNQELLISAALRGDTADVQKLLRPGKGDVNAAAPVSNAELGTYCRGHKMLTPLQAAACSGQLAAVERLLAEKPAIDRKTDQGVTALALALEKGHTAVVRTLLESGANPDTRDPSGLTTLMAAASAGNLDLVRLALRKHADVTLTDRDGATALFYATTPEVARELIGAGSNIEVTVKGNTLLHNAAQHRDAAMVEYYLEQGLKADQLNAAGQSPYAVAQQRVATTTPATTGSTSRDARRGRPGIRQQVAAPAIQAEAAPGLKLLKKEMQRLIKVELVEAGRLADAGRAMEALAAYTRVINRAAGVDTELEQQLRVGIIRYAASQPEPPVLPESSREHLVRSNYMLKNNKDQALVEQELAALLAESPWWADGYYNLGVLQTERKKLDAAAANLKIFIEAAPADPKAQSAQDKIYEIKLAGEELGKINGMAGAWKSRQGGSYNVAIGAGSVTIHSGSLAFNLKLSGDTLSGTVSAPATGGSHGCTYPAQSHQATGTFNADARVIELEYSWASYESKYHCVNMLGVPSNCCLLCEEVCDGAVISATQNVALHLTPNGR